MEAVNLIGVFPVGPEDFLCALLQRPTNGRCIPVWLPPMEGAELAARLDGWAPNRPRPVDAMAEIIRTSTRSRLRALPMSPHPPAATPRLMLTSRR